MFYYEYNKTQLISFEKQNLPKSSESIALKAKNIFFLGRLNNIGKNQFIVQSPKDLFKKEDSLNDLKSNKNLYDEIPNWLYSKIENKLVTFINTNYNNFLDLINISNIKSWKINVVALGDVGRTLTIGLRLLGNKSISEIGIFDFDKSKIERLIYEGNQVFSNFDDKTYPEIREINSENIFDCDMFVFCASKAIPPVDVIDQDVRMVQFEQNSKIIEIYAKSAREKSFNGIFAVVSDPVDLLCKVALTTSNTNKNGHYDNLGLRPEQIHGYGLGVMNARANFYAQRKFQLSNYSSEGRAFGPHGKGLIIANSISNYDENLSLKLTDLTQNANIEIRKIGFKPYIAPALSSGALSIINTINNNWHYSTVYFDGVYIGTKNRILENGLDWETYDFPINLFKRLESTHNYLGGIV